MAKIISKQVYREYRSVIVDVLLKSGERNISRIIADYNSIGFGVLIHSNEGVELQIRTDSQGKVIQITNTKLGYSQSR